MASKELILHIGAPKTGTSAFQAYCAKHSDFLEEKAGILYPDLNRSGRDAKSGKITSGNGLSVAAFIIPDFAGIQHLRRQGERQLKEALDLLKASDKKSLLLSSEQFWFLRPEHYRTLAEICAARQVSLKVLCAVRDVLPSAVSRYGQMVKRHGMTSDFEEFVAASGDELGRFAHVIEANQNESLFSLVCLNYDDVKDDIGPRILSHVSELEKGAQWPEEQGGKINRSLDSWELRLMRSANSVLGADHSRPLSDALIYSDPDRAVAPYQASQQVLDLIEAASATSIATVNGVIRGTPIKVAERSDQSASASPGEISNAAVLDALERHTVLMLAAMKQEMDRVRAMSGNAAVPGTTAAPDPAGEGGSAFAPQLARLDYYVHLWISKFPLMTPRARQRFAEAARKREKHR